MCDGEGSDTVGGIECAVVVLVERLLDCGGWVVLDLGFEFSLRSSRVKNR